MAVIGEAGWITRDDLLERVSPGTIANWLGAGRLVRLGRGVYALPDAEPHWRTRLAAALSGREAVASHASALALWDLVEHPPGPVHVTVGFAKSGRGSPGVVLHRSAGAFDERLRVDGLAVTTAERSVVDTWGRPLPLRREEVRAAAITAVRRRLCQPRDLERELSRRPTSTGRAELAHLTGLLADGCQSELEIWGVLEVLPGPPAVPAYVQQHRLVLASGRRVQLDAAWPEARMAVELDGAAFHGSRAARERDLRRDSALAAQGWIVLRFSYARLVSDPQGCRREIVAAILHRLATR